MNIAAIESLIEEKSQADKKMTEVSESLFRFLNEYSTSDFLLKFIDHPRYEFYKEKSLKGLHVSRLNPQCVESLGVYPCALKIADEKYFRELFSHHVLEYKEDILPDGIYICYTSHDCPDSEDLRVYLDLPIGLTGGKDLKKYDFHKLLLIKVA